jgi:threonine aldolase
MHEARERGVLLNPEDFTVMRAVTHLDVSASDIDKATAVFAEILSG